MQTSNDGEFYEIVENFMQEFHQINSMRHSVINYDIIYHCIKDDFDVPLATVPSNIPAYLETSLKLCHAQ